MFHTTPQSLSNNPSSDSTPDQLTRRQQLKLAVRDYGSTVMVFHITFALASLGGFYAAVSRSARLCQTWLGDNYNEASGYRL